jgi:hypothetical protein
MLEALLEVLVNLPGTLNVSSGTVYFQIQLRAKNSGDWKKTKMEKGGRKEGRSRS